ncbi:MAG: hypothetical protein GY761_16550 [Hyphomicrobiales bacterium]|nr:hypothetical protein [Hyphomicrobiales bacterium]
MIEPAPYELIFALLLAIWFHAGLKISRTILPLLLCLFLFSAGGILSTSQSPDIVVGLRYVAITFFLSLTSILFAAVIADDMGRMRLIFRAYVLAAVCTSILGIIGYFDALPGFEIFTRYSRAMGAFKDPNVFGPFLVAPILYLIYGLLTRSITTAPIRLLLLTILLTGIFLAFSRGAWGVMVVSTLMMYMILFLNEQNAKQRLKYLMLGVFGFALVVILLTVALQFEAVSSLFSERARAIQSYDDHRIGRFARHATGFNWAVDTPLGLGPLEFGKILYEETHNIWLKALMGYSWLGFAALLTLVLWTIIGGFRMLFRPRPWQPYFIISYCVFIGHILLGWVIDIDHWRHFFLLIGIIWGCFALEYRWQRYRRHKKSTELISATSSSTPAR